MPNQEKPRGRKFTVVIIVSIQIAIGMIAGLVGAALEVDLPWLSVTLPILAGVYPLYMGANAYQKGKELSQGNNAQGGC